MNKSMILSLGVLLCSPPVAYAQLGTGSGVGTDVEAGTGAGVGTTGGATLPQTGADTNVPETGGTVGSSGSGSVAGDTAPQAGADASGAATGSGAWNATAGSANADAAASGGASGAAGAYGGATGAGTTTGATVTTVVGGNMTPPPAPRDHYPFCSKTITDHCMQRGDARRNRNR
jgi:hypothetical protein